MTRSIFSRSLNSSIIMSHLVKILLLSVTVHHVFARLDLDTKSEQLTFGPKNKFWPVYKRLETSDARMNQLLKDKLLHPKREKRESDPEPRSEQTDSREFKGLKKLLDKEWKKHAKKKAFTEESAERAVITPSSLEFDHRPIRHRPDSLPHDPPSIKIPEPAGMSSSTDVVRVYPPVTPPAKKGLIGYLLEAVVKAVEEQQESSQPSLPPSSSSAAYGRPPHGIRSDLPPDARSSRVLRRQKRFFLPNSLELPSLFIDLLTLFRKAPF